MLVGLLFERGLLVGGAPPGQALGLITRDETLAEQEELDLPSSKKSRMTISLSSGPSSFKSSLILDNSKSSLL